MTMKQELKEILYKISDMHRYIFTAEMKETIINKAVDDITKLATPQKLKLDSIENLLNNYTSMMFDDTEYREVAKAVWRKDIGYSVNNISPDQHIPKATTDNWISVDERLPEELETVWCYSEITKHIFIGCRAYDGEGNWAWAESNGTIYIEDGKIESECDWDDLSVTHWIALPSVPSPSKPGNNECNESGAFEDTHRCD